MPIGRLYCNDETVWASVPVFGRDFQATHLMLAVQVMTGLADELDDRLHGEFGGKRFFVEGDRPHGRRRPRHRRYATTSTHRHVFVGRSGRPASAWGADRRKRAEAGCCR